jgi:hypothetical protein
MGIANEHAINMAQKDVEFSFSYEFLRRYPGLCPQCGSRVCACPTVPEATIGRMAKELDLDSDNSVFISNVTPFLDEGKRIGRAVLDDLGGYSGILGSLPFDRGDANRALVAICLKVADAFDTDRADLANTLRSEAYRISASAQQLGSVRTDLNLSELLQKLELAWKDLDSDLRAQIKESAGLIADLGEIMDTVHVLFVSCTPLDQDMIRSSGELRAIKEAIDHGGDHHRKIIIDSLPAATQSDLRRALLRKTYDIVHFSGHSDGDSLFFEDASGGTTEVPLTSIKLLFDNRPSIKCAILNACRSVKSISIPLAEFTIGVDKNVNDDAAIEFSRGFYDEYLLESV